MSDPPRVRASERSAFAGVMAALATRGLLLQQDKALPSVVGIIAGGPLTTSWWSHPRAHDIFACLELLVEHPDTLTTRLVGGKVTFLHRGLWPAFLAVATAGEPWQTSRLPDAARRLLGQVEARGDTRASGAAAKALQEHLLVHAEQVHTESGRHELVLRSWRSWASGGRAGPVVSVEQGRKRLEAAARAIGASPADLPWLRFGKR